MVSQLQYVSLGPFGVVQHIRILLDGSGGALDGLEHLGLVAVASPLAGALTRSALDLVVRVQGRDSERPNAPDVLDDGGSALLVVLVQLALADHRPQPARVGVGHPVGVTQCDIAGRRLPIPEREPSIALDLLSFQGRQCGLALFQRYLLLFAHVNLLH